MRLAYTRTMLRKAKIAKKVEDEVHELEEELQGVEERIEQLEALRKHDWTTYVGLSTAIMAVFAIVASLNSNYCINDALILQLQSTDDWNQYQAAREKEHLFTLGVNELVDRNSSDPDFMLLKGQMKLPPNTIAPLPSADKAGPDVESKRPVARAFEYESKIREEMAKERDRTKKALKRATESKMQRDRHESYEKSAGIMEVGISVGAVAGLIRMKLLWGASLLIGLAGVAYLCIGWLP